MVAGNSPADLTAANDRSLKSLGRAIAFSQGQFSLVLVCCNYGVLRERMLKRLQEECLEGYRIQKVALSHNVISVYTAIHLQLNDQQPSALMVLGVESVDAVDDLISTLNQVRDEFRKRHPFPMVFWVNDEVQRKLRRLAPDFTSWAPPPIRFEMTTEELLQFLQQETDSLFAKILNLGTLQEAECQVTHPHSTLGQVWQSSGYEFLYAITDLQSRGISIKRELNASLQFVFGLNDYICGHIESASEYFQQSLQFWQQQAKSGRQEQRHTGTEKQTENNSSLTPTCPSPFLLRQGVLLFYLGLCGYRLAERNHLENRRYWQQAKSYFRQCLRVFEKAKRLDLEAQFIAQLAEVVQNLQEWEELQRVGNRSLELHQNFGTHLQLACDYGFLTEVALQQFRWTQASQFAEAALLALAQARNQGNPDHGLFPLLLEQIYRLMLVKALRYLDQEKIAKEQLQTASKQLQAALENSDHRYDPHRYIRLLQKLRSLYFESGKYLEAFCIRQQRHSVEQQYGLRAFIGAGRLQPQRQAKNPVLTSPVAGANIALEIIASGRERDINQLIGRISRPDQKLTVIHGPSGVGKSSTVTAGLMPALQNRAIGDQIVVPVVVQVYTDWVKQLGKSLAEALAQIQRGVSINVPTQAKTLPNSITFNSISEILEKLQINAKNYLITVLIFDQLEEFFFGCVNREYKEQFDKFICDCLNTSFVKVIFSLREDYLHHLLDFKFIAALEPINNNILDHNIRYQLNNFSPQDAHNIIYRLTERSHLNLEPDLIDALVKDLSAELGQVRPIELQVVGSQLQDEKITTLAQYEQYRPNKLIERYIKELLKDCGLENERAALLVLYLLTDENKKRPFKTRAELTSELAELVNSEKLELILEILVRSGLVVIFPDVPERYQLIHDYLVDLIRSLQKGELSLQSQVKNLRDQVHYKEAEIYRLNSELRKNKQESKIVDNQPQQGLDLLTELKELRKRETQSQVEIEQLNAELQQQKLQAELAESKEKQRQSEVKVNRFLKIALVGSVTTILALTGSTMMTAYLWRQATISEIKAVSASSELLFSLGKDIDALREGIKAGRKLQTAFLPDNDTHAQVMTVLYQVVPPMKAHQRLVAHSGRVNSVSFSPDSSLIASASQDGSIKLWHQDGRLLHILQEQGGEVWDVSFNPQGNLLASASNDGNVKIWNRDAKLLKSFSAHNDVVLSIAWSPDGQTIASASKDKTVKLWNWDGKLVTTLFGHEGAVNEVRFSPDGKIIASASDDKTVKLWSQDGGLLENLQGHNGRVFGVTWSFNGNMLASASDDKTVKLWGQDGQLLRSFTGNSEEFISVSFSPDGKKLIATSEDKALLWRSDGKLLLALKGQKDKFTSISFSPDSRILASGTATGSVILRNWENLKLKNLLAQGCNSLHEYLNVDPHLRQSYNNLCRQK